MNKLKFIIINSQVILAEMAATRSDCDVLSYSKTARFTQLFTFKYLTHKKVE